MMTEVYSGSYKIPLYIIINIHTSLDMGEEHRIFSIFGYNSNMEQSD